MSKKKNSKITFIIGALVVLAIAYGAYSFSQSTTEKENLLPGKLEITETEYSFGTIGFDKVTHAFAVKNIGEGPVTIEKVATSCMCTTAQLKQGDKTSVKFGMDHGNLPKVNITLEPGEMTEVLVTYDPLAHGLANAAGYFRRNVYIKTSNPKEEYELIVDMTVDPGFEEQINQKPILDFSETEYDFGRIKQSGGIVQHDFPFTYNGEEQINVTGVPTSCACTSAEIDKEILSPGDTAVITVFFDPNLHAEPEGKFFKTITLMTDPALEDIPELKIWAEIDLDLGPEAFKLQTHED